MTRGTMYASARLNEAACEAHWYFLDAIRAPRCRRHQTLDLQSVGSDTFPACADCDATGERASAAEAATLARGAVDFWDGEVADVDLFRQTHRVMRSAHPGHRIDLWLEAYHYVDHHQRRLRSAPFTAYVERCLTPGIDYALEPTAFRDTVAARLLRLLLGPIEIDVARARIHQARRILQDVGGRLLQLAHLGELDASAVAPVAAAIQKVTPLAQRATPATPEELSEARSTAWAALVDVARDARARPALCVGYDFARFLGPAPASAATAASPAADGVLVDALEQALAVDLPLTTAAAGRRLGPGRLARMVAAEPTFLAGHGRLTRHALAALLDQPALAALARFDELHARAASNTGALREDLYAVAASGIPLTADTRVRLNPSLEHTALDYNPRRVAANGEPHPEPTDVWLGWFLGRGFVEIANELAPVADRLRRPLPVGDLNLPDAMIRDWIDRHLLVIVTPDA